MDLEKLPPLDPRIIEREGDNWKKILELSVLEKEISHQEYKELLNIMDSDIPLNMIVEQKIKEAILAMRVSRNIFRTLNFYESNKDGSPRTRKKEKDIVKGIPQKAFIISHPPKVNLLVHEIRHLDRTGVSTKETNKLEEVDSNPIETNISCSFHDFIEDNFDGDFDTPHPETGLTAREIIWGMLNDECHGIEPAARQRIWNRLVLLTKPMSPKKKKHPDYNENLDEYFVNYEAYLNNLADANDAIAQYIKVCDIFQNAQSQKKNGRKREGKAILQANFINKVFPNLAVKLLRERPEFFNSMDDADFTRELAIRIIT